MLLLLVPESRRAWSWRIAPVAVAYASTLILFCLANRLTTAANAIYLQSAAPLYLLLLGPLVAGLGALVFGWFSVRLSGVYLAMLTLAFAQITWAVVFQWDSLTGGSNGLTGIWPSAWLSDKRSYYLVTLLLVVAIWVGTAAMALTTSMPEMTLPNIL